VVFIVVLQLLNITVARSVSHIIAQLNTQPNLTLCSTQDISHYEICKKNIPGGCTENMADIYVS